MTLGSHRKMLAAPFRITSDLPRLCASSRPSSLYPKPSITSSCAPLRSTVSCGVRTGIIVCPLTTASSIILVAVEKSFSAVIIAVCGLTPRPCFVHQAPLPVRFSLFSFEVHLILFQKSSSYIPTYQITTVPSHSHAAVGQTPSPLRVLVT